MWRVVGKAKGAPDFSGAPAACTLPQVRAEIKLFLLANLVFYALIACNVVNCIRAAKPPTEPRRVLRALFSATPDVAVRGMCEWRGFRSSGCDKNCQ